MLVWAQYIEFLSGMFGHLRWDEEIYKILFVPRLSKITSYEAWIHELRLIVEFNYKDFLGHFKCTTLNVCLIATWKRKIKIVYFCEKLENKLRHVMSWYSFLWVDILYISIFLVKIFSSSTTKKNFFMKKATN